MEKLESNFRAKRSSWEIFRSVLFALFMREMQTRFGARRMGMVWVIMEPLGVLSVILAFHALFHTIPVQGVDFVMFMVSGIVPFHMMRNVAWRIIDAIQANVGLFSYRQVVPFDAFLVRMMVEVCVYFCAFAIICFFLGFWFDHDILIRDPIAWIWAITIGIFLSFSIGMAFAMIAHAAPSTARMLRLSYIPIYIASGVFFPIWRLPHDKVQLLAWNPYVEVLDNIRAATFDDYPVTEGLNSGYPLRFALALMFINMVVYRLRRQALRVVNP